MGKKLAGLLLTALLLAVGLYASSWAPRALDTMPGRVVGHWEVTEGPRVKVGASPPTRHYYFGPLDPVTGKGRLFQVTGEGTTHEGRWEVVTDELDRDRVRVALSQLGKQQVRTLDVPDAAATMKMRGPVGALDLFASELRYVDAETSPALVDLDEFRERLALFTAR